MGLLAAVEFLAAVFFFFLCALCMSARRTRQRKLFSASGTVVCSSSKVNLQPKDAHFSSRGRTFQTIESEIYSSDVRFACSGQSWSQPQSQALAHPLLSDIRDKTLETTSEDVVVSLVWQLNYGSLDSLR